MAPPEIQSRRMISSIADGHCVIYDQNNKDINEVEEKEKDDMLDSTINNDEAAMVVPTPHYLRVQSVMIKHHQQQQRQQQKKHNPSFIVLSSGSSSRLPAVDPPASSCCFSHHHDCKQVKMVRFDTENFQCYKSGRDINNKREWNRCWYNDRDLQSFRDDTRKTAQRVLLAGSDSKRFRFLPARKNAAQVRMALLDMFEVCCSIKNEDDLEKEQETNDNKHTKNDNAALNATRDVLQKVYQKSDEIVGLEAFLVRGIRGEASTLCRRVLTFVDEKINDPEYCKHHHHKKGFLYARTSRTISRTSRLYMWELARAQAAALGTGCANTTTTTTTIATA